MPALPPPEGPVAAFGGNGRVLSGSCCQGRIFLAEQTRPSPESPWGPGLAQEYLPFVLDSFGVIAPYRFLQPFKEKMRQTEGSLTRAMGIFLGDCWAISRGFLPGFPGSPTLGPSGAFLGHSLSSSAPALSCSCPPPKATPWAACQGPPFPAGRVPQVCGAA